MLSRLSFQMTIGKSWQGKSVGNQKRQGTVLYVRKFAQYGTCLWYSCSAQQFLFEWLHTSISSAIVKLVALVIVVSPLLPITHPLNPHRVIEH